MNSFLVAKDTPPPPPLSKFFDAGDDRKYSAKNFFSPYVYIIMGSELLLY